MTNETGGSTYSRRKRGGKHNNLFLFFTFFTYSVYAPQKTPFFGHFVRYCLVFGHLLLPLRPLLCHDFALPKKRRNISRSAPKKRFGGAY